jgi:16S rRNA (adenine1518-N6/adenine1519-N6)-dimethyltransferase
MNPTSRDIPALMRKHGLFADKRLGQNFLIDESALEKVIQAADLDKEDWVLEIGAGLGNLTRWLAESAKKVVAIEIDGRLIPLLKELAACYPSVQVIEGDILKLDPGNLFSSILDDGHKPHGYIIVANIPYYITSAVIRHTLEADPKPEKIIMMVQREVAERICAGPGKMSLLALSVQVYGKPEIISHIPANAFFPKPEVDSAILRIPIYPQPLIHLPLIDIFFHLIKAGFSQKRKTIRNALKAGLGWPTNQVEELLTLADIDPTRRAETLNISEWATMCSSFNLLVGK